MLRGKGRGEGPFINVNYAQLTEADNGFVDEQFASPPVKIPWKAIAFSGILFVVGTITLFIGCLILIGYLDPKYTDRTWPLIILGTLMFIPGAYHIRLAILAYRKVPGYSFNDIPEFN